MATGLSSPLGITGIILIIIGIIMAIIGVILVVANQNQEKPWYIWLLLVGGIIIGIIGGILLAVALSRRPEVVSTTVYTQPVQYQQVQTVVARKNPCGQTEYVTETRNVPVPMPVPQPIPVTQPAPQYVIAQPQPVPVSQPVRVAQPVPVPQQVAYQPAPTQYVQAPQQVAYQPVPTQYGQAPAKTYSVQAQNIDDDTYDPDPQTYVQAVPGQRQRLTAVGPYGPNGEQEVVTGTYKPQTQLVYTTQDYGEHPVTVVGQQQPMMRY